MEYDSKKSFSLQYHDLVVKTETNLNFLVFSLSGAPQGGDWEDFSDRSLSGLINYPVSVHRNGKQWKRKDSLDFSSKIQSDPISSDRRTS